MVYYPKYCLRNSADNTIRSLTTRNDSSAFHQDINLTLLLKIEKKQLLTIEKDVIRRLLIELCFAQMKAAVQVHSV
jgi:hypothetical protein